MVARNRVGTEYGIKSPVAHETSILEAGLDFSSIKCALSLSFSVYHFEIFIELKARSNIYNIIFLKI
jgi:hypothetical protein